MRNVKVCPATESSLLMQRVFPETYRGGVMDLNGTHLRALSVKGYRHPFPAIKEHPSLRKSCKREKHAAKRDS